MTNQLTGRKFERFSFLAIAVIVAASVWLLSRGGERRALPADSSTVARVGDALELSPSSRGIAVRPNGGAVTSTASAILAGWGVLVRSDTGVPIAGATVSSLSPDDSILEEVKTDSSGTARIGQGVDVHSPLVVVGRAAGMRTTTIRPTEPIPAVIELELQSGASITGRVIVVGGAVPGEPVTVFATPSLTTLDRARGGFSDPRVSSALTDSRGRFELGGLTRGWRYDLNAFSPRAVANRAFGVEAGGEVEPTLILRSVYGVLLKFVDESFRPVVVSPGLEVIGSPNENCSPPGRALVVGRASSFTESAGISRELGRVERGALTRLVLFSSEDAVSEFGPIRYRRQVPGYELVDLNVKAFPMDRSLTVTEVQLRRRGTDRSVSIELGIMGGPTLSSAVESPGAQLGLLILERDDGLRLGYALSESMVPTTTIEGVPVGVYRVFVRLPGTSVESPMGSFAAALAGGKVVIQWPPTGDLVIRLSRRDGREGCHPEGHIEVAMAESPERPILTRGIDGASTRIASLVPGRYRVRLFVSEPSGDYVRLDETISVAAGETTSSVERLDFK